MKQIIIFFAGLIGMMCIAAIDCAASDPRAIYYNSDVKQIPFNENDWKEIIKDIDYSQAFEEDEIDQDEEEDAADPNEELERKRAYSNKNQRSSKNLKFWATFFKIAFIIIAVATIAVLSYYIIGGGIKRPRNRKIQAGTSDLNIEQIEENIHQTDLEKLIDQATQEGDFSTAIRLYYLAVIKELSLKRSIKWKRDKTNRAYLREMRNSGLYSLFQQATNIFERVWYGKSTLTQIEYDSMVPTFKKLISAVND